MVNSYLLYFLSALFWAGVGTALFFIAANRILGRLRGGLQKMAVFGSLLAGLVLGSGLLGLLTGPTLWLGAPLVVLGAILVGEARRLWLRSRQRGSPPVEQRGAPFSLARPVTTTDLQVMRYEVNLPGWHGERLRIVQISDLHVTDELPAAYYQDVIDEANRCNPDLILLTGDFITELHFVDRLPELLRQAHSRLGVYAILGNHDYWAGAEQVSQAVRSAGVHLLYNGSRRLDLGNGHGVLLNGCEEPWSPDAWQPPVSKNGDLTLALSHSADHVYRLNRAGVQVVFSGHYHAGQLRLPGFGSLVVPSKFGRRYDHGHFIVNGTHLFVSAGAGVAKPPLRLYCPPDIFVVDVLPGPKA